MIAIINNKPMLTDFAYNVGKKLVMESIPGLASLYFGVSLIWDLPATEQVIGILAIVALFLGVCLGVSSRLYEVSGAAYNGELVVTVPKDGPTVFFSST